MRVLGIDLGTTNSAVALVRESGRPEILANSEGEYTTPSVVYFDKNEVVVGRQAKNCAVVDPTNVVQRVKRQMGDRTWRAITDSGDFSPEEVSAAILKKLKQDAESLVGEPLAQAVITVPAYFMDAERKATIDAGVMAGFDVKAILNEPTAAALAYGIGASKEERVVVYDLGGGTFDVTVMIVSPTEIAALASTGSRELGGTDWDNKLMKWLNEQFVKGGGPSLFEDLQTEQDLRNRAEAAKHSLSQMSQTRVAISAGGSHQSIIVTQQEFESITRDLLEETRGPLEEAIEDSGLQWEEIDKLLLVGGSTKMPGVARLVEEITGKKPSRELHPDEVVALGAAVKGAQIAASEEPASPSGRAAMQTGIAEIVTRDITAHSLGFVLLDAESRKPYNQVVIDRGTRLPCSMEKTTFTVVDNQPGWHVQVTQGEDRDLQYVTIVGEGIINYDTPKPANYPIRSLYSYDENGLIHITAYDGVNGKLFGEVKLTRQGNLSESEVEAGALRMSTMQVG